MNPEQVIARALARYNDSGEDKNWRAWLPEAEDSIAALDAAGIVLVDRADIASERAAEWRDIATAPKSGVWIIALTARGEVVPVRWGVSWNDQHWANGCVVYNPTHWMPLPAPPAIERADDVEAPHV
jgi:hypothetical protein